MGHNYYGSRTISDGRYVTVDGWVFKFTQAAYKRQLDNVIKGLKFDVTEGTLVAKSPQDINDIYETYSPR